MKNLPRLTLPLFTLPLSSFGYFDYLKTLFNYLLLFFY